MLPVMLKENLRQILPTTVRPRRILAGPLQGDYIVTSWHDYPAAILGYAETDLMAWLKKMVHPGETWLDMGAHYGYISLALCRYVGQTGRVFAFEPLLETAGHLSSTRRANRLSQLTVVPLALSDNEEITSVRAEIWKAMAQPVVAPARHAWVEPIYCVALDKLWHRLCGADDVISGIKMDIEGMEGKALLGMIGLLRKHQPKLIIEVHQSRGVNLEILAPVLVEAGYNTAGRLIGKTHAADLSYEFVVDRGREPDFIHKWREQSPTPSFAEK
jgi:FkbM family methyltransferase